MAPAVQKQISLPFRKMDFYDDVQCPTTLPRKENCDTAEETEQTVKLTRCQLCQSLQTLHTPTPGNIFCDKELPVIENFMKPIIENKTPGRMYISGRQRTGKTACVTQKCKKV
uniref:Uncharacterized protein n=1 Tax=Daphnia galeata TaxID=27404 RepID=A0A8J2WGU1_9CRUS|nr:unnamed protein product [Daphnia galeata]